MVDYCSILGTLSPHRPNRRTRSLAPILVWFLLLAEGAADALARVAMLSRQARLVLTTLLPSQAHPRLAAGLMEAGFAEFWLDFERTTPPAPRAAFHAAVFAATWIAPLLISRLPPLSLHDNPTRERALTALGNSRLPILRQMLSFLKTIASFCYGADPEVRAAIGYPRPAADPDHRIAP